MVNLNMNILSTVLVYLKLCIVLKHKRKQETSRKAGDYFLHVIMVEVY
jgi:hypothetical protein